MKYGTSKLKECWDCGKFAPCSGYICTECTRERSRICDRQRRRQREREARGISGGAGEFAEKMVAQFYK